MPTNSDFEAKLRTFTAKRQEKSGESVNTSSKKTRPLHTRRWPRRGSGKPPRFRHSRVGGKPEIEAVKKRQIKRGSLFLTCLPWRSWRKEWFSKLRTFTAKTLSSLRSIILVRLSCLPLRSWRLRGENAFILLRIFTATQLFGLVNCPSFYFLSLRDLARKRRAAFSWGAIGLETSCQALIAASLSPMFAKE